MDLSLIRAIGDKRVKEFNKLGINDAEDLIRYYPRAYLDLTERASLATAYNNDMVLVKCEVTRIFPVNYGSPLKVVRANCTQDGYPFNVVWFNQPYIAKSLKLGEYLFYGRVSNKYGTPTLTNPSFEPLDKNYRLKGIVPVYSLKGKIGQAVVRKAILEALKKVKIDSVIPPELVAKYQLPSLARAYFDVHAPTAMERVGEASERLALEEYFVLISAFKLIKGGKEPR